MFYEIMHAHLHSQCINVLDKLLSLTHLYVAVASVGQVIISDTPVCCIGLCTHVLDKLLSLTHLYVALTFALMFWTSYYL